MPQPKHRQCHATLKTLTLLLSLLLAGLTQGQQMPNTTPGGLISVTGTGYAHGEPDQALLTIGVNTTADTVNEAIATADTTMHQLREAALALGINERDIRTANFNVWRQQLTNRDGEPTGERYNVQHTYRITVKDPNQVSQLITNAIRAGANDLGSIQYTLADPSTLEDEAREAAMTDAKRRAQHLASLAGVTLGAPTNIQEPAGGSAPRAGVTMDAQYARTSTPTQAGELTITVTLSVDYAIQK